jgi:hypothetical protein
VILATQEAEVRRIRVQGQLCKKGDPISKISNTHKKRTDRVVQVVEHLSSKCEALSSNPSTAQKTKTKTKKTPHI